ncbi:lipopolysaccharide assembly protein LapB [Paenibacillus sp. L3-i20]|uniref:tetratricopeptide repeat protein n=1 Tax=Paenibacillus sp. L3-i20 TaxID=2905833 RepID=UPI001EE1404D|nr:tetratricopeptide repeat protein [Paenibacillus sp. L3-i20]GKU79979.1 hypothetical protein L3i20_v243760 [Paenibacillus sp. L3-i20]
MSINLRAIEFFEKNEYQEALKLFQKAVEQSRNIQSLNNLAWIYFHEECNREAALKLIKEAVDLNPKSHFPFNLLGEIYIEMEMWQLASDALHQSISIQSSNEAYNNLAIANYHLGHLKVASDYFLMCSNKSDYALYSHVKCLIELGRNEQALNRLATFSEEDDEFVGTVEIAELYVELGYFEEAIQWFEKGWENYWKTPDWVGGYAYALIKSDKPNLARDHINEVIQQKVEDIREAKEDICDDDWTEGDKEEHIRELIEEKREYENMFEHISSGYIPQMKYNTSMSTSCYLFECERHNHSKYQE